MNPRPNYEISNETLCIDTRKLKELTGCGYPAATQIGRAAGARIQIGKRVMWYFPKIREYLENESGER